MAMAIQKNGTSSMDYFAMLAGLGDVQVIRLQRYIPRSSTLA